LVRETPKKGDFLQIDKKIKKKIKKTKNLSYPWLVLSRATKFVSAFFVFSFKNSSNYFLFSSKQQKKNKHNVLKQRNFFCSYKILRMERSMPRKSLAEKKTQNTTEAKRLIVLQNLLCNILLTLNTKDGAGAWRGSCCRDWKCRHAFCLGSKLQIRRQ
jgi:hypothetical protein